MYLDFLCYYNFLLIVDFKIELGCCISFIMNLKVFFLLPLKLYSLELFYFAKSEILPFGMCMNGFHVFICCFLLLEVIP